MEEIIEVPVVNDANISEYSLKDFAGVVGGAILGLIFLSFLIKGQTKIIKERKIQEKKWFDEVEKNPSMNTKDWAQHQRRLNQFGESKYRDTHFYVGPKGGVYYITYRGTKVYC